jgi:hypothetical protein
MGQADLFASRCSVKGCRGQKICIWLAHWCSRIDFTGKSCPREGKGGKERMKKRGDQTFLSSLFFPRARFTRKVYTGTPMGEPNKNLLSTAPLHTATRRKEVGLTHTFAS